MTDRDNLLDQLADSVTDLLEDLDPDAMDPELEIHRQRLDAYHRALLEGHGGQMAMQFSEALRSH